MKMEENKGAEGVEQLLATPHLADALESDRFKQFLDHVPVAIAVSEVGPSEAITYCNLEFERLTGQTAAKIQGNDWKVLPGVAAPRGDDTSLGEAVQNDEEYIGTFTIDRDAGVPMFRLVALASIGQRDRSADEQYHQLLRDKDFLLRELQHRVKNNLQMITALIRMEARNVPDDAGSQAFQRLAGRISSLALLYQSLSEDGQAESVDLGVYLSQVASAVMAAHAVEGIRLNLQVDTWPVSVNVAMPTGLVVNELLINALKYAFVGRDGGTITLHSLVDETGCRVTVSDDGVGLAEGVTWPKPGKLSALIVHSLGQNAKAKVSVDSVPGAGLKVSI